MKFFMSIYFKLLYVDNHSKDLLAEINFLVWRPYHRAHLGGGKKASSPMQRILQLHGGVGGAAQLGTRIR